MRTRQGDMFRFQIDIDRFYPANPISDVLMVDKHPPHLMFSTKNSCVFIFVFVLDPQSTPKNK